MAVAPCIRSRSDSEPTRIPTRGASDMSRDVRPEVHAGEIYACRGVVGRGSRRLERVTYADDVEDPSPIRDELPIVERRPRVEDERAGGLSVLDALDRRAPVAAFRVLAARDDERHRGLIRD